MAVTTAFASAVSAFPAAPLPRPPQPIKPILRVSPGEAAEDLVPRIAGAAAQAAAVAEAFKNWRREVRLSCSIFMVKRDVVVSGTHQWQMNSFRAQSAQR